MIYCFDPLIYPQLIWVSTTPDVALDKFDEIGDFDKESTDACTESVINKELNRGGMLIRFRCRNAMTVPNITHESIHAANGILGYCGVITTVGNDEALAYLAGWIAEQCMQVKNKKK